MNPNSQRWRDIFIYLFLALSIWLPRGVDSDKFVTVDEPQWLYRSANFYYSLAQREFGNTSSRYGENKNLTPGVITMWVETFAFLLEFPEYRGFGQGHFTDPSQIEKFLVTHDVNPLDILVTSRQIFTIFNTVILLVAFAIARRLFGLWPSLLGFLLIAFEPYHIALTKIAHLDGPLSGVMLLAILAFLAYVYDGRKVIFIVISGIASGIAVLIKIPGIILIPFVGLVILLLIIDRRRTQSEEQKAQFWSWVRRLMRDLILWGVAALSTFMLIWPEMWADPIGIINQIITLPFRLIGDTQEIFFGGAAEQSEFGFNFVYAFRYITSYIWHTTPIILFGLLGALIAYFRRASLFAEQKVRYLIHALMLFVLVFVVPMSITGATSNRYIIPVYLPLNLVAALGWVGIATWIQELLPKTFRKYAVTSLLVGVVLFQTFLAVRTHPYYFSYFNPLLGGSRTAGELFESGIGLGEGLDQAARYLNAKPESEKLRVRSWYYSGPFSYFFLGETKGISERNEWTQNRVADLRRTDYLVTYINQWKRRIPAKLFDALESIPPEHSIWINEIEYARIYKVDELPQEFFEYLLNE